MHNIVRARLLPLGSLPVMFMTCYAAVLSIFARKQRTESLFLEEK
jgi:hypothetical protein